MEGYFFKPRKNFDFNPNKYDLGLSIWKTISHLDMHFLNKIIDIDINEYPLLYDYHLTYYLETYKEAEEKHFFSKLYDLILKYKTREFQKDSLKMSPKEKTKSEKTIKDYEDFIEMMKFKDQWGVTFSEKEDINNIRKNLESNQDNIVSMKMKIKNLNNELTKLRNDYNYLEKTNQIVTVSSKKKIDIKKEYFGTVMNLMSKLKDIEIPIESDTEKKISENLFVTNSKSTWVKIITNNFSQDGEEIKYSRVENYLDRERNVPRGSHQCIISVLEKKVL
ncbi:hypothetical protein [Zobellia barbeyronii]|uniref:Uncharacterized protein n=1 Tax=Zobellia barbeyronii TaxID=2748009 RepID=A0ABS5WGG2_9FLAO|nr:hypothetical protein [Zobellia barbeyronii]MBT2161272.1 hypothetical protein [Zobellia barbeyronii]